MADCDTNVFYTCPEEGLHAYPVIAGGEPAHVAEPRGQYRVKVEGEEWPRELRRIELRALRAAASGQIARLLQLANLLQQPEPVDRPAAELASHAEAIREATNALEDTLRVILDPLTEAPPEPGEEEDQAARQCENAPVSRPGRFVSGSTISADLYVFLVAVGLIIEIV